MIYLGEPWRIETEVIYSLVFIFVYWLIKIFVEVEKDWKQKIVQQTSDLEEVNNKLKNLSYVDSLTLIPNRRNFDEYLYKEWKQAIREKEPLSLLMMDIDYFKLYNDHYGHTHGDECLKKVAETMKSTVKRPRDFIARYGGEEFVAILPNTGKKAAQAIAKKIQENLMDLKLEHQKFTLGDYLTISIGVATVVPTDRMECDEIIKKADQALYKSKEMGRNQIVAW